MVGFSGSATASLIDDTEWADFMRVVDLLRTELLLRRMVLSTPVSCTTQKVRGKSHKVFVGEPIVSIKCGHIDYISDSLSLLLTTFAAFLQIVNDLLNFS